MICVCGVFLRLFFERPDLLGLALRLGEAPLFKGIWVIRLRKTCVTEDWW